LGQQPNDAAWQFDVAVFARLHHAQKALLATWKNHKILFLAQKDCHQQSRLDGSAPA
jgi:hypothetical protein